PVAHLNLHSLPRRRSSDLFLISSRSFSRSNLLVYFFLRFFLLLVQILGQAKAFFIRKEIQCRVNGDDFAASSDPILQSFGFIFLPGIPSRRQDNHIVSAKISAAQLALIQNA